jgi:hypothetical protein
MVRIDSDQDWESLLEICEGQLGQHRLGQLRDLLGVSCRTVIVERDYVCKDYRDTYTNYYAKKFASYPDKCTRLLFFRKAVSPRSWWNVPSYARSFMGYTVIRPTRISYNSIGRTILDPDACSGVQGYICRTRYTANLMGTESVVNGFPHISQDTDVTVCAHAACWSCFRYFSERYPAYREIYPYQITQLTTDLSGGRLLPSRGLYMEQVVEMFSRYGFYPRIYFRRHWDDPPGRFERLLYYYLESGLPLVVGLDPDHAVTTIGHTSDLSLSLPAGQSFSDGYLTGLVINDDNSTPYQALPRSGHEQRFATGSHLSDYRTSAIDSFVVPLYERIYLAAEDVERLALALVNDHLLGPALARSLPLDDLVMRIFLTTSRAYKAERRRSPLPYDLSRVYTQLPMPKFIWVSELSTKALYPDGKILGETIWDATASDGDYFSWLAIHYPELLLVNDRTSGVAGISTRSFPGPQAYELYRHNLHWILPFA